jgi:MYXO-CTERM domain-containing protein
VWPGDGTRGAQLAYRVRAGWREVIVGGSGEILVDRDARRFVDGSGLVFDPSPVVTAGDTSLVDDDDADSTTLDAARVSVTLPRLDGSGFLRGAYVDARPANAANRASSADESFQLQRSDDHFEEVMAYFHLDRAQDRIESVLGFDDVEHRAQVAIVDAFGDDNSYYEPDDKTISYGAGGVDDAEDADIVLHEYGHAIQDDQVPGFGAGPGDGGALGEGFGDYLAASFTATFGNAAADPACVGDWDAVAYDSHDPPCLRRVDGRKHYPEAADGEPHDDGEMWSAALWDARTALGADTVDSLVLESHFALGTSETFQSAGDAILAADANLFAGANTTLLRHSLLAHGLSRTLGAPSPLAGVADSLAVSVDNARTGATYDADEDDVQTVTFPGASAVRVHFDLVETEEDASCFERGCDNVYLFDGAGELFQIIHGSHAQLDSVSIPGDTVKVRLVSDFSVNQAGYHISRIDSLDGSASLPDAGVNAAPDAGPGPDAGGGGGDDDDDDDGKGGSGGGGGCGCRLSRGGSSPLALLPLMALGGLVLLARRRR